MTVVIAHRGASGAHPPGNTIDAFLAAGPLGATWVELDVRLTADGRMAVHHDPVLPDGRVILHVEFADLPDWVPDLDAALDACTGLGVNIEIKNDPDEPDYDESYRLADEVCRLADERDPAQPLLVSSFNLATIDRVHAIDPNLPTAHLVVDPTASRLHRAADRGHAAVHPRHEFVTAETVALTRALGISLNVWTVDDPGQIAGLAALGVDGVVTNVPDVACSALA